MTAKRRKSLEPGNAPTKRTTPAEKPVAAKSTRHPKAADPAIEPAIASKQQRCLDLLARRDGATLAELVAATEWQPHSVRGFLSGTVKKKLGLTLVSSRDDNGNRRYRLDGMAKPVAQSRARG
ncbi:MAG: hypothetical protein CTY20_00845 [Hyphomicrobium sp.]|nr:MAG: hypothetical protein CTY20_00845 [Hyphomicrobium sp.]